MTPSTSPSDPGGRRGPGLAVIDTPPGPPGWEAARTQLVRIVDPLGRAVAWLAPAFGGSCVGLAVRPPGERGMAWVHIIHAVDPSAWRPAPGETGCGVKCTLTAGVPPGATRSGGGWRFIERDPTAVMLAARLMDDATAERWERDGGLHLRFSAALDDGTLALDLLAENRAAEPCRLHLGLELSLVGRVLRDAAGSIRACLPGRPIRQDSLDRRIDIPPGAVARLGGSDTTASIELTLVTGVARLCYFAPAEQTFASLLASADASPDGLMTMDAGATFRMAIALRAILN